VFEVPERFNAGTLVDRNPAAGRGDAVAIRCAGALRPKTPNGKTPRDKLRAPA
jgi:hypothetical protein